MEDPHISPPANKLPVIQLPDGRLALDLSGRMPRPIRSPEDGPIVEIFPGVFHAAPIDETMLDGSKVIFQDFYQAAVDTFDTDVQQRRFAGEAFNGVFGHLHYTIRKANKPKRIGYRGYYDPLEAYRDWGISRTRRPQLLLSTQAVYNTLRTYETNTERPQVRKYKFLNVLRTLLATEDRDPDPDLSLSWQQDEEQI